MKLQFVTAILAAVASGGSEAGRSDVRDLDWSELTGDQRNAAALLGFDQASWDGGEMTLGRFLEGEDMSMQELRGWGYGGNGNGGRKYYGKAKGAKSAKSLYDDYDYDYYGKSAKSLYDDYDYDYSYSAKSAKSYRYGYKSGKARKDPSMGKFTAPHEVHQYEQVKFSDEPEWLCEEATVAGVVGCLYCYNPRPADGEALVVEVKSMYKREDFDIKNETLNKPRKHCIFPERGGFYTCFNSNLVIEPDTAWLGELSDKPIYDVNGTEIGDGGSCYPGALACLLNDTGSIYY